MIFKQPTKLAPLGCAGAKEPNARQAPSQWLRRRQGAEFAPLFSTLSPVKHHRNGCAGAREAEFCSLTLSSVKHHRNGCAGAREPNFAPFSTLSPVKHHRNGCARRQGAEFWPPFSRVFHVMHSYQATATFRDWATSGRPGAKTGGRFKCARVLEESQICIIS